MKKKISILLIIIFMMSGLSSLSLGFNDVSTNHWAYEYINDMEKSEIITGFDDGTIRPDKSVTKMSSITMIYRLLKDENIIDSEYIEEVKDDYSLVLQRNNVPNWAKDAVTFALDKEIIVEDELKTFMDSDNNLKFATKGEVSVYLGKALFFALDIEKDQKIYSFDFKDYITIPPAMTPYIDLLVTKGIVSGDNQGNFNTNSEISRAVISKMLSISKDLVKEEGKKIELDDEEEKEEVKDTDDEEGFESIITGQILLVSEQNETLVIENDSSNEKEVYKLSNNADILINGRNKDLDDLDEGDKIKLNLNSNGLVIKVSLNEIDKYEDAKLYNVLNPGDKYYVTLENKDGDKDLFETISKDEVKFYLNDELVSHTDLKEGMAVESVYMDDGKISELYLASDPDSIDGVLLKGLHYEDKPYIKVRTYNGKELKLVVDDDTDVKKNNNNRSLKYLTKGDIVTIKLDDNIVEEIIATSIVENSEGRIESILISEVNKLTVRTNSGDEVTYDLDDQVDIEIDNDDKEIYDLRLNYKVDLDVESGVVKKIDAKSASDSINFQGFINTIYKDEEVISINTDKFEEMVSVSCDGAKIYDEDGDRISLSRLDEDDEVLIFAKEESELFDYNADRIYIVE